MRQTYIAEDHLRHLALEFPDGLVPPLVIILEEPGVREDEGGLSAAPSRQVVFWCNPQLPGGDIGGPA